ncbi:MAG TPA: efflux RND transporter periplasmic adaptor subunit [Stellaceae bacterium]|nr:efflux RND transporter periplasmic adaptor subunit [Stellaceae bacterium]
MSSKGFTEALPRAAGRPRKPRTRGRLIVRLAIVIVLMLLVGFGLYSFQNFKTVMIGQIMVKMAPPPAPVAAVTAKLQDMPRYLEGIGSVTAVRQVTVSPEVAGRITQIMFEAGQTVKAGAPLVQIYDTPDRADLANFQAQERLAQVNLGRAKVLAAKQFGSQQAQDQAQMALDQAHAGIAKTEAVISQKLVRAPFAGELGIRQVNLGQYLNPGNAIATLTDLDTMFVDFTLPEQASGQIKIGQAVEITSDAFPDQTFGGKLTTIEPQVDPQTRSIKLEATIPNRDHRLRPGMFANARVVLAPEHDVVTVPETAVEYTPYGTSVYIVKEVGKDAKGEPKYIASQSFVTLGEHRNGDVAVKTGLKAGQMVASSGQLKIINNAPVRLSREGPLKQPAVSPRD